MTRIFFSVFVLIIFCNNAHAQTTKPIKDTAAFLSSCFSSASGEQRVSKAGKYVYTNHYTITSFAVNGCTLQAVVKMKYIVAGKAPFGYTLSYSIPLESIWSVKPVADATKDNMKYHYTGAPLEFRAEGSSFAIKYKMIEDLTGRVEANAGYNEGTLWCNPKKSKQVLEVLKALSKRCQPLGNPASLP